MDSSAKLHDEVTELSYKLEALSDEIEASATAAADSSVPERATEPPVDNFEELNGLHCCLEDQQAQLVSQTERFEQLEQQQQIRQDAQMQQAADTLKAIEDISGRVDLIEQRSGEQPQASAQDAQTGGLADVQQALHAVQNEVGCAQTLTNSTMEMQSKCMQDIADLSSQMEDIKGRLEQPGTATAEDLSVEALRAQLQELTTDIESYQKRSENVQNGSNAKLQELSDAVAALREQVGEHVVKLAAMEADAESRGAAASSEATEQRAHVDSALQLMEGELSALSEVIGNIKAESAELREIVGAERNMSSQLKDDILTDKIALEERLEEVEERMAAVDLDQLHQSLRAGPAEDHTAQPASDSIVLDKDHASSTAAIHNWKNDLQQLQEQLGAHIHDLSESVTARLENVTQQAAALSGQVEDTSKDCKNLQEGMKLLQDAFLEMQAQEPGPQPLSQAAAEELSLRVASLHEQFEDMKTACKSLMVEERSDAQVTTEVGTDIATATEATSAAFESFKAAVSERLPDTVCMPQLQEMKAVLESEIQSIRSSMLQSNPQEIQNIEVSTQHMSLSCWLFLLKPTSSSVLDRIFNEKQRAILV